MTPTTIVAILTQARALIERGWTKGALARNAAGRRVDFFDPTANQLCAVGALIRVTCQGDYNSHRENAKPWRPMWGKAPLLFWEQDYEAAAQDYEAAAQHLREALPGLAGIHTDDIDTTIVSYNDMARTTHADILALFDRAIAGAQLDVQLPSTIAPTPEVITMAITPLDPSQCGEVVTCLFPPTGNQPQPEPELVPA